MIRSAAFLSELGCKKIYRKTNLEDIPRYNKLSCNQSLDICSPPPHKMILLGVFAVRSFDIALLDLLQRLLAAVVMLLLMHNHPLHPPRLLFFLWLPQAF